MAEAEEYITGDWKEFTFHVATDDDLHRIAQYMGEHFFPDEPLGRHMSWLESVWNPKREADLITRLTPLLKERLSLYVTPKDSDEIVAVNLISDSRSPTPPALIDPKSDITRTLRALLVKTARDADPIFQSKFPCDHYAYIFFTSVHSGYRCQGIAVEMYERSEKFLKAKGFPAIRGQFSHPGTQRLGQKFGFDELQRVLFKDQVNPNGKKIFPTAEHEFLVDAAKKL